VRPTNQAILHAFLQFGRLVRSLPDSVVVIVAGNHDTPRSTETGGILQLFAQLGISVVDREPTPITLPDRDLYILAVPDVPGSRPDLRPTHRARYNVLVLHGDIPGTLAPHVAAADPAALQVSRDDLNIAQWSYVALGHHHVHSEIAPNAFYSGSIDYTSVDTWGELDEQDKAGLTGKGIIEYDLETAEYVFHALPAARQLIELQSFSARGMSVAEVNERIAKLVERCDDDGEGGIDDKIVRLVIYDLPRHVARELDHKALREYKRRALNFQLDTRRPEPLRLHAASGAPGRRATLVDFVRERLMSRTLESDIDRDEMVKRALAYLTEAENVTLPAAAAADA